MPSYLDKTLHGFESISIHYLIDNTKNPVRKPNQTERKEN